VSLTFVRGCDRQTRRHGAWWTSVASSRSSDLRSGTYGESRAPEKGVLTQQRYCTGRAVAVDGFVRVEREATRRRPPSSPAAGLEASRPRGPKTCCTVEVRVGHGGPQSRSVRAAMSHRVRRWSSSSGPEPRHLHAKTIGVFAFKDAVAAR
jgi:hypothetical protein